jgi:PIN domain nuclease of toxin-antitoxin system
MSELILFLDTCALLYLASGSERLSRHAISLLDSAGVVFVSPISAWEISLKVVRNQLDLPIEPKVWFSDVVKHHRLEIYPLTPNILMAANRLPWHHNDPADRFIVASAAEAKATLVTTDEMIRAYNIDIIR